MVSLITKVEMPADSTHDRTRLIPFRLPRAAQRFVVCSVCLSVRDGDRWIEASEAIRRLRTFEHPHVVRLGGALCEQCETSIRLRRRSAAHELAA